MNEERIAVKIWNVLYPFLFYYAVMLVTMTLVQWIVGADREHYVLCQMLSGFVTVLFMLPFYREDCTQKFDISKDSVFPILAAVVIAGCIGTALNNIISMTPLVELSKGYQEANAHFYGSTLALELVSSALVTPVLEELVFRGIIFTRLKRIVPKIPAVILSALVFSLVHFNMVQFIYALLLGIVLALLMEGSGHVSSAIAGHMTVNFLAVLRTETGLLENTVQGDTFSWVFSIFLLATGLLIFIKLYKK